jgi:gamma-glutamyltranspeptidase/glutathione hydrolase
MHFLKSSSLLLFAAAGRAATTGAKHDKLGAVSSENYICSQIGIGLLQAGGSAADALVGTVFCVGVVAPYHSGIGGGGFMLVRGSNGSYEFIDFRESMPAAGFQDMYNNDTDASLYGGLASGVPGELRGTEHLHKKYGKLPWATVMQPAINLAYNGFPVNADTVRYFSSATPEFEGSANFLTADPNWAIDFAPNGTLLGIGDTLTRKRYAATLQEIAKHGADAFYTGPIAEATIEALATANASKGIMTLEDLKNYTVAIQEPLSINYRDFKITSTSAPSSGEVVLSVLNAISGYSGFGEEALLNLSTHRLDEAIRFGYGQVCLYSRFGSKM